MDEFLQFGSDQACNILRAVGSSSYEATCLGYANGSAYERAGIIFWVTIFVMLLAVFYIIRKAIGSAFH